jgi:hypothetical protein
MIYLFRFLIRILRLYIKLYVDYMNYLSLRILFIMSKI